VEEWRILLFGGFYMKWIYLLIAGALEIIFYKPGNVAACNEGVDSCWLNFFDPDQLAKELGLPENEEILMLLDLGYAAEGAGLLPNHDSRKPLSETVSYL
jgi:nitroreductase